MNPSASAGLWAVVVAIGVYHGLNPAMGWPLAVANGLSARRGRAVLETLAPLATGHLLAMAVVLVPFTLLSGLLAWSQPIRLGAGLLVLSFGAVQLALRRHHPRLLARIPPTRLAWWSFVVATAHGAGLMLVPVVLGLCAAPAGGAGAAGDSSAHATLMSLMRSDLGTALGVAGVHTLSMVLAGLAVAWLVYRTLGLRFIARSWFNLDLVWNGSLVLAGGASCWMTLAGPA